VATLFTFNLKTGKVTTALNRLAKAVSPEGLRVPLDKIGEDLVASTKRRFETGTSPEGKPWAPNSNVTIARYLGARSNIRKKDGSLNARGERLLSSKRPLINTGNLASSITRQSFLGGVSVGSPRVDAATHQFGAKKGQFGKTKRGPIPWGDIPARPFLGMSSEDETATLAVVRLHLLGAIGTLD
jgi:phage virion morphogenesis protein